MNCEKFESLLLDELYGELDELTSAAMRKHAQSCLRCAPQLEGLRRTRAAFQQHDVEVPSSLEARILSAVADAEKVTPIDINKRNATQNSGWVSRAGRWAMRPQTAMAALFVLMLGSSAVLMHSRQSNDKRSMSVEEMGSPADKPASASQENAKSGTMSAGVPQSKSPPRARGEEDEAKEATHRKGDLQKDKALEESNLPAASAAATATVQATAPQSGANLRSDGTGYGGIGEGLAGKPSPSPVPPSVAEPAANTAPAAERQNLQRGLEQYKNRDYDNARRSFQTEAKNDPNAALWAARSARDGSGKCNTAVKEFDALAKRARGTPAGDQATLESAKCLRAMGAHAEADDRLRSIENSPTLGPAAKAELESNRGRATRNGAPASPKKAAPSDPAASDAAH